MSVYNETARGFDKAANAYDDEENGNAVLEYMRSVSWQWFTEAFELNLETRLLELGSGTGLEAARLAEQGYKVALLDVSAKMLETAVHRVELANPNALLGQHCLPASQVQTLVDTYGKNSFDGAYSSFGPLNCEPALTAVAIGLAQLIKPGGKLVFSIMPKYCLTEILWFSLHGELKNATRRWRGPLLARALPNHELLVKTYYYTPGEVRRSFAPYFQMTRIKALPLLWPPPYLTQLTQRFPRFFAQLKKLDSRLTNALPMLAVFGDHFLIEFVRL